MDRCHIYVRKVPVKTRYSLSSQDFSALRVFHSIHRFVRRNLEQSGDPWCQMYQWFASTFPNSWRWIWQGLPKQLTGMQSLSICRECTITSPDMSKPISLRPSRYTCGETRIVAGRATAKSAPSPYKCLTWMRSAPAVPMNRSLPRRGFRSANICAMTGTLFRTARPP